MNKKIHFFKKSVHEAFGKMKEEEQVDLDEIMASWDVVQKRLSPSPQKTIVRKEHKLSTIAFSSFAAAVLLFVFLYAWQANISSDRPSPLQNVIVAQGENRQIILPDGSKLYINANSHVAYPVKFRKDHREISLLKGEIYLEVVHNPQCPFIVNTKGFNVRVLGTKFDVSLSQTASSSVVLVKGSVQIENKNKKKEKTLLSPNQLACISSEGIQVKQVDVSKYICWRNRIILLEGDTLGAILQQLSSFYGVNIYCDKKIENFTLSGTLNLNDSVEKTIRIIKLSTGFDYQKENNKFYIYKK